ncbi:MAG: HAD-IA family hydrolase [Treponema sp.]|nr:HAD-IA family hydrolase [Treponema sp.]
MLFIFDMGGVVTTTFKVSSMYEQLKMTEAEFKQVYKSNGYNLYDAVQKGEISVKEFWTEFNSRIKDTDFPAAKYDLFRLCFNPVLNEKTVKLINKLKKKNRVVCGTNTLESHWENHMERGDYALFHKTYPSNKMGVIKPDPEFFRVILKAEGCEPENAFFTDDRMENVEAARSVGINAVQFTSAEELTALWKKYC